MKIKETFINQTKGYRWYDGDWEDAYTNDRGKLFRSLQKEYGRCTGAMHFDMPDGKTIHNIGWVFEKRMKYEDARGNNPNDYYIREVWVSVAKEVETIPSKTIVTYK